MRSPSLARIGAAAVHLFTGIGGIIGLLALLSASEGDWRRAFVWLGAALIVDGLDGPLARLAEVEKVLPRFSGKELDQVVDYLNYVTVPAFILARSEIAPETVRVPLAAAIMLVSLYHFADTKSKTSDGYFVGFPAIWNVVMLYCLVLSIRPAIAAYLILACAFLTFVPLYWVHPLRVRRLRLLTFAIVVTWIAASIAALIHGFPGSEAERVIFILTAAYVVAIGVSAGSKRQPRALVD